MLHNLFHVAFGISRKRRGRDLHRARHFGLLPAAKLWATFGIIPLYGNDGSAMRYLANDVTQLVGTGGGGAADGPALSATRSREQQVSRRIPENCPLGGPSKGRFWAAPRTEGLLSCLS